VVGVSEDLERAISETAYGRRTFLRRLVVGSAFAVPVVSSFSMAGVNAVSANANQLGRNTNTTQQYPGPSTYCGNSNSTLPDGIPGQLEEIFKLFTRPFGIK
jgi:hypothetical protein